MLRKLLETLRDVCGEIHDELLEILDGEVEEEEEGVAEHLDRGLPDEDEGPALGAARIRKCDDGCHILVITHIPFLDVEGTTHPAAGLTAAIVKAYMTAEEMLKPIPGDYYRVSQHHEVDDLELTVKSTIVYHLQ